jgi:adenylate kinase
VRNRLRVYTDQTAPVIDYYRDCGKLKCVYGVGSMDDVLRHVLDAIDTARTQG